MGFDKFSSRLFGKGFCYEVYWRVTGSVVADPSIGKDGRGEHPNRVSESYSSNVARRINLQHFSSASDVLLLFLKYK